MSNAVDRSGLRYGKLEVLRRNGSINNYAAWLCRCDCGVEKTFIGSVLTRRRSCGCFKRPQPRRNLEDLFARRFGAVVAVCRVLTDDGPLWECKCDCGNISYFSREHLVNGRRTSCGCRINRRKHDMCDSPEYSAWRAAKERCSNPKNPKYKLYGGRGIAMSAEWYNDFRKFLDDIGRRPSSKHSLERKDVNGNYCKDNCIWATSIEQNNNLRSNTLVEVNGEIMTAANASRRTGISYRKILKQIADGKTSNSGGVPCLIQTSI